jgi:hypothetical protein
MKLLSTIAIASLFTTSLIAETKSIICQIVDDPGLTTRWFKFE